MRKTNALDKDFLEHNMNDKKVIEFSKNVSMDAVLKSRLNRITNELLDTELRFKGELTDTAKAQLIVARQAVSQAVNALR